MNSETIVMIAALAAAILAVSIVDAGLVVSLLVGAGVAALVAVVGTLLVRKPPKR